MRKRLIVLFLAVLFFGLTAHAIYEPDAGLIYEEDFNDGTYNTDYWIVVDGDFSADGTTPGTFAGDDPIDEPYGKLSFGTAVNTEIKFDLYKLVVTDLGYDPNDLQKVTFEFDLAQTNGTAGAYRFSTYLFSSGKVDQETEASPEAWRYGGSPENQTSFASVDGVGNLQPAGNDGTLPEHRLNVNQWAFQGLKYVYDIDQYYTTRIYQDPNNNGNYDYVAYIENWHPSSGNDPFVRLEQISFKNRDGVVSWYLDNVRITLDDPYLGWTKILEDKFDDGDYSGWTTGPQGYWTVQGENNDPMAPWGAVEGKMAAAEPNSYFKINFPATTPGDLVAVSFDVQQANGSDLDFPVFVGLGDAESDDYYVEYASPALSYSEVSGTMIMMNDSPNGNGSDPLLTGNDDWWSFGAGIEGKRLSTGANHIDLVFNPWENYPDGSISLYIDGELAAKWVNFRNLYSFDEVFFGIRNNIYEEGINSYVPCWNFDNIKVYTREPVCGDGGYPEYDFNKNCKVDLPDFAKIAENWLECTIPLDSSCFQ